MLRIASSRAGSRLFLSRRIPSSFSSWNDDGPFASEGSINTTTTPPVFVNTKRGLFGFSRHKNPQDTNNDTVEEVTVSTIEAESEPTDTTTPTTPSFDDTMTKLFSDNQDDAATTTSTTIDTATATASDVVVTSTTSTTDLPFDPTWYNLADQAIQAVNWVHDTTGLDYGVSIIALTTALRVVMIPVFVKGQRNTSRMAHMQPEMQALKDKLEALGPNPNQETQVKYGLQMKALFQKYNCNPLSAMMLPLVQAPVFMSMFMGLRKMPTYFGTELSTGGMLWFPDLTLADPLYILPIGSALSFLVMIELGKDQMMATNPQQGQVMLNVFRGMTLVMIPVALQFSSAVLCYWVTNNTFSLLQSVAFRNKNVRRALDIWDPPKPVPGSNNSAQSITDSIQHAIAKAQGKALSEKEKMEKHNAKIESRKKAAALRKKNTRR